MNTYSPIFLSPLLCPWTLKLFNRHRQPQRKRGGHRGGEGDGLSQAPQSLPWPYSTAQEPWRSEYSVLKSVLRTSGEAGSNGGAERRCYVGSWRIWVPSRPRAQRGPLWPTGSHVMLYLYFSESPCTKRRIS